jgi:CMP-2-keto-3-deoxyoctulosonic acid synthetase
MNSIKRDPGKAISAETLQCWAGLRREFFEEYEHSGLISVENKLGIHLTEAAFLATFNDYKSTVLKHCEYPEQLDAMYNKVRFFCVRKVEGGGSQ